MFNFKRYNDNNNYYRHEVKLLICFFMVKCFVVRLDDQSSIGFYFEIISVITWILCLVGGVHRHSGGYLDWILTKASVDKLTDYWLTSSWAPNVLKINTLEFYEDFHEEFHDKPLV